MSDQPTSTPIDVSPEQLEAWLADGDTLLVDVREGFEHAAERIDAAQHLPLGDLDPERLRSRVGSKRVVFHCRSGKRSHEAATRYAQVCAPAYHLRGGIEAWKASGRGTIRSKSAPRIDVMRQVQITAGLLVLVGVVLGVLLTPWLLGLSAFVGAGLTFAGLTGWCGMAKLLSRAPWNRAPSAPATTR